MQHPLLNQQAHLRLTLAMLAENSKAILVTLEFSKNNNAKERICFRSIPHSFKFDFVYGLIENRRVRRSIYSERAMGLEPTISCLGSMRSTTELRPHNVENYTRIKLDFNEI
jgi:hypothetical protein